MVVIIMGVAGAGKTAVGAQLARDLGAAFVDADQLHSPEARAKMAAGVPLGAPDRAPWLARVRAVVEGLLDRGADAVVACSALRRAYRQVLAREGEPVRFVYLRAPPELLAQRIEQRAGSFFNPVLLQSQLTALEEPRRALVLDAALPVPELVTQIRSRMSP